MGRGFRCAIGRGGIGVKEGEGDGITPVGTHRITRVFVRQDRVSMPGTPIFLNDVWSDDPDDPEYNSLQRQWPYPFSHEKLRRADPLYDIVAELDFNSDPVVSGKGSAIFLHVWRKPRHPTEGCVAFCQADLKWILERWTSRSKVIVIG